MSKTAPPLAATLLSEIFMIDQLARSHLSAVLPKGMELSHFFVLNRLAAQTQHKTPAQLAESLHLSRGALTNTLRKLEWSGYIHVTPDWDDARRKQVVISPAGRAAYETALSAITPLMAEITDDLGDERLRATLPVLRALRNKLGDTP